MTIGEITVWIMDLAMLAWLVRQGEILIRLEREKHRMVTERYEERAKWRQAKQKSQLKSLESAANETHRVQTPPTDNTKNVTN